MDWIEDDEVQMLSNTFRGSHTTVQTENLYRSMSRIMISLAKIPQSRIGSWTITDDGQISLSNRPMLCWFNQLENWSIPTGIPRNMTYTNADSFHLDLLAAHDNRLLHQKNAVFDEDDAKSQAKDLVLMKALLHQYTDRKLRNGPFVMQLTDIHESNLFVDKDWNIKYVIDLEWACSLPLEILSPPFWLTGKGIDQFYEQEELGRFSTHYNRFVDIFTQEEKSVREPEQIQSAFSLATHMITALEDGRYWYSHALQSPKGLFNVFRVQIQSKYDAGVPKIP